ncbi:uncharacterized protein HKW66_Vig0087200 [Vigna angularis]|uniref:Uncharacterized protein n=1 Tax=Phaseolus angularis TaxID=3914 RepID=A0A8T0KI41_PHAAN|nr:uncharacterized protein HKW66_Vig0087200 [Vigna angularis]
MRNRRSRRLSGGGDESIAKAVWAGLAEAHGGCEALKKKILDWQRRMVILTKALRSWSAVVNRGESKNSAWELFESHAKGESTVIDVDKLPWTTLDTSAFKLWPLVPPTFCTCCWFLLSREHIHVVAKDILVQTNPSIKETIIVHLSLNNLQMLVLACKTWNIHVVHPHVRNSKSLILISADVVDG